MIYANLYVVLFIWELLQKTISFLGFLEFLKNQYTLRRVVLT